jgi:hypothetical protein
MGGARGRANIGGREKKRQGKRGGGRGGGGDGTVGMRDERVGGCRYVSEGRDAGSGTAQRMAKTPDGIYPSWHGRYSGRFKFGPDSYTHNAKRQPAETSAGRRTLYLHESVINGASEGRVYVAGGEKGSRGRKEASRPAAARAGIYPVERYSSRLTLRLEYIMVSAGRRRAGKRR